LLADKAREALEALDYKFYLGNNTNTVMKI
jgi:hypothetical protein